MQKQDSKKYSMQEFADLTGYHLNSIAHHIATGHLKKIQVKPRAKVFIPATELVKYLGKGVE